ncbi:MAG: hypothetical protein SFU86_16025, partial [Pirellulaceae bacterium]|nr:hypothetical protein [Pirellulaceae bacterium]
MFALTTATARATDIELPVGELTDPIRIRADGATHFPQGGYEVWVLRGDCRVEQGKTITRSSEAVLWIDRAEPYSGRPSKVIAYLEGNVELRFGRGDRDPFAMTGTSQAASQNPVSWLGRFHTTAGIEMSAPLSAADAAIKPAIYERGTKARDPAAKVAPAQFVQEEIAPPAGAPIAPAGNRVRIFPRAGGRWNFRTFIDEERNERVVVVNSGVQVNVEGLDQLGSVSLETDRIVIWLPNSGNGGADFSQMFQSGDGPMEFYMEGNIVFRQGDRVIYADRMYYNVRQDYGVVLKAEMLTPVPQYQGLLRLKAEVLQQVDRQHFEAYGAALTSSRIGVPRYWFQTQSVSVDDLQTPLVDPFTGQPLVDPQTGEPVVNHQMLATSRNNAIYLGGVPVFYWPVIATDLLKPTYYVDQLDIKNDRVFGTQVFVDFDLYQLLGIENPIPGTKWSLSTDYLSLRGPALGTSFSYQGNQTFGIPGAYRGFIDAWGISDSGDDNLGRDWRNLAVPDPLRGRLLAQERRQLPRNLQFTNELGLISDRNFLEQYYEKEWDTFKDLTTGFELKQFNDNRSWSITGDARPNGFVTDTEWGRFDHFMFGQPLLFDRLTWHEHSSAGYGRLRAASAPTDPAQIAVISPLPWEANVEGYRATTRQQLEMPVELGPTKFVPYLLGEAATWAEDVNGQQVSRFFGQAGIKASLPIWKADPTIKSELFNLNGMAHKAVFEVEGFISDASQDLNRFALYDQLDDNATEFTRRQMAVRTFGQPVGTFVPQRFDERYFALRSAMQGSVAAQSTEIADDLAEVRFGVRQRWQTKRGLPGQE